MVQFFWNQCQANHDVCINYDVSPPQQIPKKKKKNVACEIRYCLMYESHHKWYDVPAQIMYSWWWLIYECIVIYVQCITYVQCNSEKKCTLAKKKKKRNLKANNKKYNKEINCDFCNVQCFTQGISMCSAIWAAINGLWHLDTKYFPKQKKKIFKMSIFGCRRKLEEPGKPAETSMNYKLIAYMGPELGIEPSPMVHSPVEELQNKSKCI